MHYGSQDYVRCGGSLYYVTWPKVGICGLLTLIVAVVWMSISDYQMKRSLGIADESNDLPIYAARKPAAGSGSATKTKRSGWKTGIMDRFCEVRGSLYYLDKWRLASLGSTGYASASDAVTVCDVKQKTETQVPFSMCTFDRNVDTQVSAFIHNQGAWNPGKKDTFESLLPVLPPDAPPPGGGAGVAAGPSSDRFAGRTLFIDVGANIGFYTLLAAARGYDVIAIEPSKEAVTRLLMSLDMNGIKTAAKGNLGGARSKRLSAAITAAGAAPGSGGRHRDPTVYVYQNAASDSYNSVALHYIADNPGASWVEANGQGDTVTTVFLDDMLALAARDPAGGSAPPSDAVPPVDPTKVRMLKISAEGWDARVLAGARRLLSLGRIPWVHFVFNRDHVTGQGCTPDALVTTLFEHGYKLYYSGVFIYREVEMRRFLKGMAGQRSIELLFAGPDVPLE